MQRNNYKDRPAVIVESDFLIATILPEDGGKIVSLRVRDTGKELLITRPEKEYKVLAYDGDFEKSECSGFDDMFPTVDPYTPEEGVYEGITYPDHGEVCRLQHKAELFENGVVLHATSKLFPIDFRRKITPAKDGGLDLEYCITNKGEVPFPFLWAGHMMLQAEEGMRLFLPFAEDASRTMVFQSEGTVESELPLDHLPEYKPGTGPVYKVYYDEPMREGRFGLSYPDGGKLTIEVDVEKTPYVGIWYGSGQFQDLYAVILEPCTVPYDAPDIAKERGYTSIIPAKSEFTFSVHIAWENND